jgi:vacuolar-type H+-ATPase subunit E/Vma4
MDGDSRLTAQLAPLETALMAVARKRADERLREAHATAERVVAESTAKARAVLEQAAAEGRRATKRAAEHRLVDGRREARRLVLAAQNAAYQRLVCEAIAAAEQVRGRPEYRDLEGRLIATAKAMLGPDATIVHNPDGGVRGLHGSRTVDLTLATLARRCVERFGDDVTRLWA